MATVPAEIDPRGANAQARPLEQRLCHIRYDMSFAAVQKHAAVLERAHVVTKRRRGREQLVSGDVTTIRVAARLLGQYEEVWRGRIGRIEEILTQPPEGEAP
jgi:DNA-binding transcriptional ArsR family regulator